MIAACGRETNYELGLCGTVFSMIFANLPRYITGAVPFVSFDVSNCLLKRRTYITESNRTNKDLSILASSVLSLPAISELYERPYTAKSPQPNCPPALPDPQIGSAGDVCEARTWLHSYCLRSSGQVMRAPLKIKWLVYQSWFNLILVAKHHKMRGGLAAVPSRHSTGVCVSGAIQPLRSVSPLGTRYTCAGILCKTAFFPFSPEMAIVTPAEHATHFFIVLWPRGLQHLLSASNYQRHLIHDVPVILRTSPSISLPQRFVSYVPRCICFSNAIGPGRCRDYRVACMLSRIPPKNADAKPTRMCAAETRTDARNST
jgi:hypothetical protein